MGIIAPGFDSDGDNNSDVFVMAGDELVYELRRTVDPKEGAFLRLTPAGRAL